MRMRKIVTLTILAVALALPGVSLAKREDKHGIGKGGVPALRDYLQGQIDSVLRRVRRLEHANDDTQARLDALEGQFVDADGDGSFVLVPDCDDEDANVSPEAAEVAGNGIDDDCDGETDEAA
jgi:hypothetical protein